MVTLCSCAIICDLAESYLREKGKLKKNFLLLLTHRVWDLSLGRQMCKPLKLWSLKQLPAKQIGAGYTDSY